MTFYTLTDTQGRVIDRMTDAYGRDLLAVWLWANRRNGAISRVEVTA